MPILKQIMNEQRAIRLLYTQAENRSARDKISFYVTKQ
jgi:hypothetical protein